MIVVQLVGVAHLLCRGVDWLCCGCWPVPWNVYWLVLIGGGEGCVGRSTIKNQSFSAMCNWGSQQAKQLVAGSSARANSFSVWRSCRCTQQGLPTQTMHFWKANPLKWPYVWMSYPSKMGNLINDPCKVNLFERHAVSVKLDFMLWPTPWGSCRQSAGPTSYRRMSGAHISWKDPSFGCLHSPGSSSSPCADSTESNSSCESSLRLPKRLMKLSLQVAPKKHRDATNEDTRRTLAPHENLRLKMASGWRHSKRSGQLRPNLQNQCNLENPVFGQRS